MKKKSSFFIVNFLFMLLCLQPLLHAAGTTVAPAFVRFSVSEKKQTDASSIYIKNSNATAIDYEATIVDVDTSSGSLMPQDTTSQTNRRLFSISTPQFSLVPEQSINMTVTATNFADLSPGGHYAALAIRQKTTRNSAKNVPIQPIISVGIFLVKEDGAVRQIQFSQPKSNRIWFKSPSVETFRLNNSGNVDIVPSGFVAVQRGTMTLFKDSINTESQPLMPQATNEYKVAYSALQMGWPGKYKKTIAFRYSSDEKMTVIQQDVWYMPLWCVVGVLGLAAVIIWYVRKKYLKRKDKLNSESTANTEASQNEVVRRENIESKKVTKKPRKKSTKTKK